MEVIPLKKVAKVAVCDEIIAFNDNFLRRVKKPASLFLLFCKIFNFVCLLCNSAFCRVP